MFAIYKKELGQYFYSMIGFVFLAFFLVIVGVYTWAYNFTQGYGNFELTLNQITFLFVILIPIVTMRVMAEENHQKTDQLLLTSPISVTKIILGKYLSVMTLFSIGMAVISLYPLLLHHYNANVRLSLAYSSIIGFYLMGAAYIAVGVFISTLTESQIIAAVVSFITLLISFLMSGITDMLPSDAFAQCLMLAFVWLILSGLAYRMMANIKVAAALAIVGEAVIWILYAVKSTLFEGVFSAILNAFAVAARFNDFELGILNYDAVVYYITVAGMFVFLSIQVIKKRNYPASRQLSTGAYNSLVTVLVVAVVVFVNMVFGKLDLMTDLSSDAMFTLTEDTKRVLQEAKQNVTLYYMVEDGQEVNYFDKVLAQYDKVSDKVKLKKVDPVVNPSFSEKYVSEQIASNDVIVVNDSTENAVHVEASNMFYTSQQRNGNYTSSTETPYLDVEGQITAAMQRVLSETQTKMYIMGGHNELALGSAVTDSLEKLGISTEDITLYSTDTGVPEDCDILLLNGPENDISDKEKDEVLDYLKAGGSAIFNVAYTTKKIPNIQEILEYYGVEAGMGNIVEQAGYYYNSVNWIIPTLNPNSDVGAQTEGIALFPGAIGLTIKENVRESLTAETILSSSAKSYLKVDLSGGDAAKAEGDIDGPFDVGVSVQEKIAAEAAGDEKATDEGSDDGKAADEGSDDGKAADESSDDGKTADKDAASDKVTRLVVYGCATAFTDTLTSGGQFINTDLIKYAATSMVDSDVKPVAILAKDMSYTYVSVPIASQIMWAALLIVVMPLGLLICGGIIWFLRRR